MKNSPAFNDTCARLIRACYDNGSLSFDPWYNRWVYVDPFSNEMLCFNSFLQFVKFYIRGIPNA